MSSSPSNNLIPKLKLVMCHNAQECIEYAYLYYVDMNILIHKCSYVHINNHTSCLDMHEHWLLCKCIMPNTYKNRYFRKTKFQICLHAYLGTIRVDIRIFQYIRATVVQTKVGQISLQTPPNIT